MEVCSNVFASGTLPLLLWAVGCGGQAWILGHHFEAMAVVRFKVMDQGDGGGNEKWMDLGSRINKTWVVRKGKKAHM